MSLVVDDATVAYLSEQSPAPERRWPVGWTVLIVVALSTGLWAGIFLAARQLAAILGPV